MKKQDIICISMTTWEGDYMKTIVHMMSQLAKQHRVLFVDYGFTWKDLIYTLLGKSKAPVKRMLGWSPRLRKLKTREGYNIYHLTLPPLVPINWIKSPGLFKWMLRLQTLPIISTIKTVVNKLKFEHPVMINAFHPVMGIALADRLPVSRTIYYCYDEIRAAQWAGTHGGTYEDAFIPKVDGVVVTSEGLYVNRKALHPQVTLIKNGVDFDLFHQAFDPNRDHARKVVGYLGSIDDRLDYDLLEYLIKKQPNWDFHFVGRVTYPEGKNRLSSFENVTFFGALQPDEIPGYLKKFDVGIIPFVVNQFTQNIYPLKINEYLAAGLPVVSTNFANLDDFNEYIEIADRQDIFYAAVVYVLDSGTAGVQKRIEIARQNGWETRAIALEQVLDSLDLKSHV